MNAKDVIIGISKTGANFILAHGWRPIDNAVIEMYELYSIKSKYEKVIATLKQIKNKKCKSCKFLDADDNNPCCTKMFDSYGFLQTVNPKKDYCSKYKKWANYDRV